MYLVLIRYGPNDEWTPMNDRVGANRLWPSRVEADNHAWTVAERQNRGRDTSVARFGPVENEMTYKVVEITL